MKFVLKFGKNEKVVDNKFGDESFTADLIGCGPITIFAIAIFIFSFFKLNLDREELYVVGLMSLTFAFFGFFVIYRSFVNKIKFNKKEIEIIFDKSKINDESKVYKLADKEIDFHIVIRRSGRYKVFEYINVGFYLNDMTLYYNFDLDSFFEFKEFIDKYTDFKLINIKE